MTRKQKLDLPKLIGKWRADPLVFVETIIGATPEKWQAEVLTALPDNYRIAVKSGHGVGKTALEAWIIIWFLVCHAPCKVPCTAPTAHQLKDILWSELRKWVNNLPELLKTQFELTSDRLSINQSVFAVARTARKENPDAFQGFHEDNLLFVGDEASGIEEVIFEVAQGALSTKGARIILFGNPTRTDGYFYRCFNINRDSWKTFTVSCLDSTRVDQQYIDDCIREYGEDSNFYRVRVLGEFPESGNMQFISTADVERCTKYHDDTWHAFPLQAGLDIARHGDDKSVLVLRQGRKVHSINEYNLDDLNTLAGEVAKVVKQYPKIKQLALDTVGMGVGVYDILAKWGYDTILQPVNAGERASNPDRYVNKRAEMWDRMRLAIKESIDLPNNNKLVQDLTGLQYDYDMKQRLQLEKKSDMKKRGLSSPDIADALALTYAYELGFDIMDDIYTNHIKVENDFSLSDYL